MPAESCSPIFAWSLPLAPQNRAVPVRISTTVPGVTSTFWLVSAASRSLDRDLVLRGQGLDVLEAGDVDQHAARDDGRNRRDVGLPHAEVAAPVGGLEAVVEVAVRSVRDVREPVDLRRDVVVHEDDVAVPRRAAGVAAGRRRERQVLLRSDPAGDRKLTISPAL